MPNGSNIEFQNWRIQCKTTNQHLENCEAKSLRRQLIGFFTYSPQCAISIGFSSFTSHLRYSKRKAMIKMKKQFCGLLIGATVLFAACGSGDNQDPPEITENQITEKVVEEPKATEMAFEDAFSIDANGKMAMIEGYMQLPASMYSSNNSGSIDFSYRPNQRHGESIRMSLQMGNCKNCMKKLADKYDKNDLEVTTEDGTIVGPNVRVRVTGKLRVYESSIEGSGVSVSISNQKIEKVEEVELDYSAMGALKISSENFFDSTLKYVFSTVEGKIEIPTMLFMQDDATLSMKVGKENLSISFLFGNEPNHIEDIPKNYSKKDFKIHDFEDKIIDLKKPVKLYGTRTPPRKDYGGILYVERVEQ